MPRKINLAYISALRGTPELGPFEFSISLQTNLLGIDKMRLSEAIIVFYK